MTDCDVGCIYRTHFRKQLYNGREANKSFTLSSQNTCLAVLYVVRENMALWLFVHLETKRSALYVSYKWVCQFLSPPVQFAWRAYMHQFLFVVSLSVRTRPKIRYVYDRLRMVWMRLECVTCANLRFLSLPTSSCILFSSDKRVVSGDPEKEGPVSFTFPCPPIRVHPPGHFPAHVWLPKACFPVVMKFKDVNSGQLYGIYSELPLHSNPIAFPPQVWCMILLFCVYIISLAKLPCHRMN